MANSKMRRLALLMGGADLRGKDKLQGIERDLLRLSSYLRSDEGGAWESNEVLTFKAPDKALVKQWLRVAEYSADYCLILFGGHGCHYTEPLNQTAICLNDSEEMTAAELNPRTKRHLVLLDVCRKNTAPSESLLEEKRSLAFSASAERYKSPEYRASCRELFDTQLLAAEEGRSVAYSCNLNQAAGDSVQGGFFTQAMIRVGEAYAAERQYCTSAKSVLDVPANFRLAHAQVQRVNYPQDPVLEDGRRLVSFPFAVR